MKVGTDSKGQEKYVLITCCYALSKNKMQLHNTNYFAIFFGWYPNASLRVSQITVMQLVASAIRNT